MEGHVRQSDDQGGAVVKAPFFVAAAHELKSPLALVRQLSLNIEQGNLSAGEIARYAHQITLTSERALRTTTDLTKNARLEDSLFTLEPLNPVSICEEVVAEVRPLYQAMGRDIVVSPRSRPLLGLANRELLRRVLLNFADNALHYAESDEPVVLQAMAHGDTIRIGVRDRGPAIPVDTWQSLTHSLGERQQPLHSRPASSGLGIYLARQFAEAMSAEVGATRHRDGATFFVDITASMQLRLL